MNDVKEAVRFALWAVLLHFAARGLCAMFPGQVADYGFAVSFAVVLALVTLAACSVVCLAVALLCLYKAAHERVFGVEP